MYSKYDAAQKAYTDYIHTLGNEFIPFGIWLERQKQRGAYWGV